VGREQLQIRHPFRARGTESGKTNHLVSLLLHQMLKYSSMFAQDALKHATFPDDGLEIEISVTAIDDFLNLSERQAVCQAHVLPGIAFCE
jgi:hypothetical protein